MRNIDEIIEKIDTLDPIPQLTHKIIAVAEDPESSMKDVAELVSYDQAMTASVLKICNSAYFGLARRIDSIHQAVTFLGMDQIVNIVIMKIGSKALGRDHEGYDLMEGELWKYSVLSALMAQHIAERTDLEDKHAIFTAALLKDIGKVVLHRFVHDAFTDIEQQVQNQGTSFMEAERAILGIDHAELGGLIAKKWEFSPKMTRMIRNHHLSVEWTEDDAEMAAVYLADTLCMMMGIGVGADGLAYRFHEPVLEALEFSHRDLPQIMVVFAEKLKEIEDLIRTAGS
jgi:putative nucleotidyltransferase with HDIG domain